MADEPNLVEEIDSLLKFVGEFQPVTQSSNENAQNTTDICFMPIIPPGHTEYSWSGTGGENWNVKPDPPKKERPASPDAGKKARDPPAPSKKQLPPSRKKKSPKVKASDSSAPKKFDRRDGLCKIELEIQKLWDKHKAFESDPKPGQEKYMCTFPYPYTNGHFHIGHAFSLSKAEFAAGYQRLKGKNVLFPFGFHCTGMPIAAAALKLQNEVKQFGNPPQFPVEEAKIEQKSKGKGKGKGKKKKGKAAGKKSGKKYQWQIMQGFDLTNEEILEFRDPAKWLMHFPPVGMRHLKRFGLKADFRRSMITTEMNPFYDAFIRWQFTKLKEMDKVAFGKRPSVFDPSTNQVCGDHDRASGEGKGPQNYTLIKIQVIAGETPYTQEQGDQLAAFLEKGKVFLVAGTLRPETMYGQTNCFVLPNGEYCVVETVGGEFWVTGHSAARNMLFQGLIKGEGGEPTVHAKMWGKQLLGRKVKAPYAQYEYVYVLPLLTIKMDKATGIVTSVPSDAPADYAALMDMKKNAKERKKYYITDEMVENYEVVEIINIPATDEYPQLGRQSAVALCKAKKVKSQKDEDKIEEIKDIVYNHGFSSGTMLVGPFKGELVKDAKDLVKARLIEDGLAAEYWEPEAKVVARTGTTCVVCFTDQWFLRYGEEKWRNKVQDHVDTMEFYNPKTKDDFNHTIGWLKEWACSREFGLGTRVPFDEKFVIESLSDSTIYWAYYTICHHLQGDCSLRGEGSAIDPKCLTNEVFDYVFLGKCLPKDCPIPVEKLKAMREEFLYYYPIDLRVSGKDLIRNHLTMAIYNHAAIWEGQPDKWPRSYYCNGHIQINGEKMSKSTGNFFTIKEGCDEYSADALRLTLADGGDGLEDANFDTEVCNAAINRLHKESVWMMQKMIDEVDILRTGDYTALDKQFDNAISTCILEADQAYSRMQFKNALRCGFYNIQRARDFWRNNIGEGMEHRDLVTRYIRTQLILLSPICPHFCEYYWQKFNFGGLCVDAEWPKGVTRDFNLHMQFNFVQDFRKLFAKEFNRQEASRKRQLKKKPDTPEFNACRVYVAADYLDYQVFVLETLKKFYAEETNECDEAYRKAFKSCKFVQNKKDIKKLMDFAVMVVKNELPERGAEALSTSTPFDELATCRENLELIVGDLKIPLENIDLYAVSDPKRVDEKNYAEKAIPRKPMVHFFTK